MTSVPESIVRAIAAAPNSHVKEVVLGSMGLTPGLEQLSEEDRELALNSLEQFVGTDTAEPTTLDW